MSKPSAEIRHVLGRSADAYPLVAERVAIDATNALRGAEMGLRGFRRRPLLRRLWDGITGQGQELQAAIGQDLVTVQRATLSLVREVMDEEARTQYCVNRVLVNLHAVNRDVDDLLRRTSSLERDLEHRVAALRAELYGAIRAEAEALASQIETVKGHVDREASVRRLTERYRAGDLTAEPGEALGGALFLASIAWHYWAEPGTRVDQEWAAAAAVVRQRLGSSKPRPVSEAVLEAALGVGPGAGETALYLAESSTGVLHSIGMLTERRLAQLAVSEEHATEAVSITRALADPDRQLESGLVRDIEVVEAIAKELLPLTPHEGE